MGYTCSIFFRKADYLPKCIGCLPVMRLPLVVVQIRETYSIVSV